MSGNQHRFSTNKDATDFYLGTAACMMISWHSSVVAGFIFGNFAPSSLSLDYAVPLSFVALLVPNLKTKKHFIVAIISSALSLLFFELPFRTGPMVAALLAIVVAWFLIQRSKI
jgi:predicted branched-subunit amino acid permease